MTPKPPADKKRRRGQRDMSAPIQEWRFEVGVNNHGSRLDSFLSTRLDWRSRNGIKEIINDGCVEVLPFKDPQQAQIAKMKVGLKLRTGQEVVVRLDVPGGDNFEPAPEGKDPDIIDVVFEDEHIVAINKPPGLNVHPTHGHLLDSVIHRIHIRHIALYGKTVDMPTLCHRLDRDTTGLVVLAKNQMARTKLGCQFEARTVRKAYQALVEGEVSEDFGVIDLPLARDEQSEVKLRMGVFKNGMPSHTKWEVEKRFDGMTLLKLFPKTGRQHQLRVHLAAIGHPIVGDKLYMGGNEMFLRHLNGELSDADSALLKLPHQALHSWKLGFEHPDGGEFTELEAPLWSTIA
ncbi:MAG: RluA family pseudouridine synthase, partial [Planctomycetota bacterium]|nr:RluA family pseudouridine synthase [Planctomycetota bacterium]